MSPALPGYDWKALPWRQLEGAVFKLRKRIFQASRRGETKAVHRLQRLLIRSRAARYLAVRKVTQDNRGKRTAGVDGVKKLTPPQRLKLAATLSSQPSGRAVRRVWIPKPGTTERRPLGIPTIRDRAAQTLVRLALEPEWEARFEPSSFGFRPGRSAHEAIELVFTGICKKPKYVLDADIAACFERLDHAALLDKLGTCPALRRAIRGWLKAGILDGAAVLPAEAGAPQGGPLSPLLANVALHGLETRLRTAFPRDRYTNGQVRRGWQPLVVRYADDFVVLHEDLGVIEQTRQLAAQWLASGGLELKPEQTRISHTLIPVRGRVGFDAAGACRSRYFPGFEVRQYRVGYHRSGALRPGFKTIIKPSKEAQKRHSAALARVVRRHRGAPQAALVGAVPADPGLGDLLRRALLTAHCSPLNGSPLVPQAVPLGSKAPPEEIRRVGRQALLAHPGRESPGLRGPRPGGPGRTRQDTHPTPRHGSTGRQPVRRRLGLLGQPTGPPPRATREQSSPAQTAARAVCRVWTRLHRAGRAAGDRPPPSTEPGWLRDGGQSAAAPCPLPRREDGRRRLQPPTSPRGYP